MNSTPPSTSQSEFTKGRQLKLADGVIIASTPLIAYSLLYALESGFFDYWNLPKQFISFELSEIFAVTGVSFVITILIIFNLIDTIYGWISKKVEVPKARYRLLFAIFINLFILIYGIFYYINKGVVALVTITIVFIIFNFSILLPPIRNGKGKIFERFSTYEKREKKDKEKLETPSLIPLIINGLGIRVTILAFIWIGLIFLLYEVGNTDALQQSIFPIIKEVPECAVVYQKSDRVICINFSSTDNTFSQGYKVINFGSYPNLNIENEYVGQLKPKPIVVYTTPIQITVTPTIILTMTPTVLQPGVTPSP